VYHISCSDCGYDHIRTRIDLNESPSFECSRCGGHVEATEDDYRFEPVPEADLMAFYDNLAPDARKEIDDRAAELRRGSSDYNDDEAFRAAVEEGYKASVG
jgi:hypothetical protein